jgi:1-acyl-sn-glycerol-3-phosphate acyltransferase
METATVESAPAKPPAWTALIRLAAAAAVLPYVHTAYRIRGWGRLPRRRGPTLVIANHQHDLDSLAIMALLTLNGPWSRPIHTISSRRMFEPGFFAVRTPWVAPLVRGVDASPLFAALGPMPIENDLRRRALLSVATSIRRRHGDVAVGEFLDSGVLAELELPASLSTKRLTERRWFDAAQSPIELRMLLEPHRTEVREETRRSVDADLSRIEATLRAGATFFLTPEGHYTTDGRMLRFRDAFARLAPLADVWLAAIAYDVLRGKRLSQLYRLMRPQSTADIVASLKAARPVTVSQLLSAWFVRADVKPFTQNVAVAEVQAAIARLSPLAFVDPELRANAPGIVRESLATCEQLAILTRDGECYRLNERRRHPQFGDVRDIVDFQAQSFAESVAAWNALERG